MKEVKPSEANGTVRIPASKSMVQRAVAAATLAHGTSIIHNPSTCNDCIAALNMAKQLGATVVEEADRWIITGSFRPSNEALSCGEAGLSIRMFTPIVSTLDAEQTLTGHGSLTSRPMEGLEEAINQLGATCRTSNGRLPITVQGPMIGGSATIDGSLSSQVLTGLLMAAPLAQKDVALNVTNLKSRPYIDMTVEVMSLFGVKVENKDYEQFSVKVNQQYTPCELHAEGDWSGAAFFLVAGAIAGRVKVENVSWDSKQADKAIINAIRLAGAKVSGCDSYYEVETAALKAFAFDATNCPDLFPPLAVLAIACKGTSLIKGVSRLIHKESNRAEAIKNELTKAGITVEIEGDEMYITGGTPHHCTFESYNDHRMAMAAATMALIASDPITITTPECVNKSYPEFWEHLEGVLKH